LIIDYDHYPSSSQLLNGELMYGCTANVSAACLLRAPAPTTAAAAVNHSFTFQSIQPSLVSLLCVISSVRDWCRWTYWVAQ